MKPLRTRIYRVQTNPQSTANSTCTLRVAPTLTSLNEDVLLHLSRLPTVKDRRSSISTCRYLLKAVLARPLRPRWSRSYHGLNFLSAFAPASFLALRNLDFIDIADVATLSIAALKRATSLHMLLISFITAKLIEYDTIVEAMSSLSNLDGLKVLRLYPDMCC